MAAEVVAVADVRALVAEQANLDRLILVRLSRLFPSMRSILDGERDPERLAAFRDYRCHASHAEIVAALTGNYRAEHLFALRQNFAAYEFLLKQIAECDGEIETLPTNLSAQQPPPSALLPASRKRVSRHQPQFDIRGPLHRLTGGVDLSQIDSIGPQAALQIVAEIGTDMRRWKTEKHSPRGWRWRLTTKSQVDACSVPGPHPPPIEPR